MTQAQQFKAEAYKTLSNSHGMEIMVDDMHEDVYYRYSDEGPDAQVFVSMLSYDMEGDAYFMEFRGAHEPKAYYLNEFLRL